MVRTIEELRDAGESAWPSIKRLIDQSDGRAVLLPAEDSAAADCLYRLQVTTGSALGALAACSGGVIVDRGFVRLLGGGHKPLPSLADANNLKQPGADTQPPRALEVARDVLGGRFSINGGYFPGPVGGMWYFAPDSLEWQPLELGHGDFVTWALTTGTTEFYADLRWDGWGAEVGQLALDQGLSVYPPLFSKEGRDLGSSNRRPISWIELAAFHDDMREQLANLKPGQRFNLRVSD